ncbi:hypothetical protein PAHAL_4G002500 [Panicum hallii]|uniref:Gamma-tubulin complex component n=1 Tax=Panicum hallii TaxID=206008 RepID=A0A2S3HG04_9POAL|nr:uncharacterized protein LOC112889278 [Panicum hallii]PAN22185.1 hypothetical protein PAHAL_4G002500 [Panicum hallii]
MAPAAAAAMPESESKTRQDAEDTRWLQTLSEPELGLLIGLKEVAMTRASNAGHPDLADKVFHVRALRALAFVLLQELKERLRQASVNTSMLERLSLLNDHDPEGVVRPSQDVMPMPNGINKKRKQMQDGCHGEDGQSPKRRKATREDWLIAGAAKPQVEAYCWN